jgi:hypothetical protein
MLTLLLANANNLKAQLITVWNKSVRDEIGAEPVPLAGDFAADVKHFDFSIFKPKSLHRRYFSRFSGRPKKFGERGS